jgi:DNA processing protein
VPDASPEFISRISLMNARGVGPVKAKRLLKSCGSAGAVFRAPAARLRSIRGIGDGIVNALAEVRRDRGPLSRDVDSAREHDYTLLACTDSNYSPMLAEIYDPPALLWISGQSLCLSRPGVAIVGTRKATSNGLYFAYALARDLSRAGLLVVSGLAYGVDRKAHEGALDAGGQTVAVLGSGLDHVYPSYHRALARRIEKQGALVSEFPLTMPPEPGHFPRRNRIVSGLCLATIVVESHEGGGALLTARFAIDQNRDVYAVPGRPDDPAAEGTNRLIQRGEAQLLLSAREIIDDLRQRGFLSVRTGGDDASTREQGSSEPEGEEETVLGSIAARPTHIDSIVDATGMTVSRVLVVLLQLEFSGYVRQLPGKHFVRLDFDTPLG